MQLSEHSQITMPARFAESLTDAKIAAVDKLDLIGIRFSQDSNRILVPIPTGRKTSLSGSAENYRPVAQLVRAGRPGRPGP